MSKLTIGVVGAGVFGLLGAIRLAEEGNHVTVFEMSSEPMRGASHNNQNRLHLGFHYPRSKETALQCIEGFSRFVSQYPDCVSTDFQNCYAIASQGSMTSAADFIAFCDDLALDYREIEPQSAKIPVQNVDLVVETDEAVYDSSKIAEQVLSRFGQMNVALERGIEVLSARQVDGGIELSLSDGRNVTFDAVVNATYANQNRLDTSLGHPLPQRQFEYTAVPVIDLPVERAGMTIMDGGFMTILPFGFKNVSLLYHVDHSVIERDIADLMPRNWLSPGHTPFDALDTETHFKKFQDACSHFTPIVREAKRVDWLRGPRMVLSGADKTDARPSIVRTLEPNYLSVFSGKTDHAPLTAEIMVQHFAKL